jgi:CubicO group peptidase (beta-lactamase class C family)
MRPRSLEWSGLALIASSLAAPLPFGGAGEPPVRIPPPAVDLRAALEEAQAQAEELSRLRSFLVSLGGEILVERYYKGARASRPANIKSASKSVMSALIGIAIERGDLPGLDAPIGRYFPQYLSEEDPKSAITLEDLLSMRSGLESTSSRNYGAWVSSRSWVRHALERELIEQPGGRMIYSTGNTHLLSAILTKATGESTWAFAQDALARPLGFELARWPRDSEGIYFGGNDMEMTPRQMWAFGELYRNRGRAGGEQVLPEWWIDRTFLPRGRSRYSGREYGYGWWMRELGGRKTYYAWGYGGQFIFLVPDLELVAVTTSTWTGGEGRREHLGDVYDVVGRLVERLSPLADGAELLRVEGKNYDARAHARASDVSVRTGETEARP